MPDTRPTPCTKPSVNSPKLKTVLPEEAEKAEIN